MKRMNELPTYTASAGGQLTPEMLAAYREATTMPQALIRTDLNLAFDVLGNVAPQVTLNCEVAVDVLTDVDNLRVCEVSDTSIRIDLEFQQQLLRRGAANSKDICQTNLDPLFTGKVGSGDSCHLPITPDVACDADWSRSPTRDHGAG